MFLGWKAEDFPVRLWNFFFIQPRGHKVVPAQGRTCNPLDFNVNETHSLKVFTPQQPTWHPSPRDVARNCIKMLPVYVKGFNQRATQLHLKSEISYWAQKLWNRPGSWQLHIMLHMSVPLNNQRAVCVKLNASIGVNRHRKLLNHLSTRPIKNIFVFFALAAKK